MVYTPHTIQLRTPSRNCYKNKERERADVETKQTQKPPAKTSRPTFGRVSPTFNHACAYIYIREIPTRTKIGLHQNSIRTCITTDVTDRSDPSWSVCCSWDVHVEKKVYL